MFSSGTYYRRAAGEGATYIGLVIVVYDTLAGDLRRAGEAAAHGEIGARCEATNHALLLLGHLESWAESLEEEALRASLGQFYGYLRAQTIALQVSARSEGFEELAALVEGTRAAWQHKEMMHTGRTVGAHVGGGTSPVPDEAEEGARMSWSA